jgi:glycerol-1-phosphate dehydrogenase [NAD(P)+]
LAAPPEPDVVVAEDAVQQLASRVGAAPALVVCDANTYAAIGDRVAAALLRARTFVFPQREGLLARPEEAAAVRAERRGDECLVAVGAGVITDLVRYAAADLGCGFISVPTAASMDGYASSMAAMQIDGIKVTTPALAPTAIFADPRVLAGAPAELTRAGIGDLLGKASALVDWQAAHLLLGEAYDEVIATEVEALVDQTVANVEPLLGRRPEAAERLLLGLISSGFAITRAGSSRPASGCEHHASHFWDLLAARGQRDHHLHGLQVGYATHFAMLLQSYAYAGGVTRLSPPAIPSDPLGPEAQVWLGEPTEEIRAAVEETRRQLSPLPSSWPADRSAWQQICRQLEPSLRRFTGVGEALRRAGIPSDPGFLGIDAALLEATFRYATRLRGRFTVIDLLEGQGLLDAAITASL